LGFSTLIFFGSFLYQDKKEHANCSLQCFPFCDATLLSNSLAYALRASPNIGISLHPGLKPWANPICPYRAFGKVNTHQVLRANEGI